jgi:Mg-chelatase subunit ChlD
VKIAAAAAVAALALAAPFAPARADDDLRAKMPIERDRPRMEVAFVLDTTGSMGGLIETAKRKIWTIANELARAKPAPEIRLGLVAFRDRGDAYVTRIFDLDADLDRAYARLSGFQADGGGDGPESVNQALRDAVTRLSWTKEGKVLKVVFLVGDAPPHMDYDQDVPYAKTCEEAARAGITVNTLRCGGDPATERVWAEIARLAEGTYASIPQEGSQAVATPYDVRIAELGGALGGTLVAYGDARERDGAARKMKDGEGLARAAGEPAAASSVAADRAVLIAKLDRLDEADLVAAVASGKVKLEDLPAEKLPPEMAKMTLEERREFVAKKSAEREALRKELGALEAKRAAFLAEAAKKAAAEGKSAFDLEVSKTLRAQAEKKGFTFAE